MFIKSKMLLPQPEEEHEETPIEDPRAPLMQQLMEQQRKQAGVTGAVGAMLGLGASRPAITPRQQTQIQQEMQAGMAGPWIRGVEAARALERLGEAQAAGRFYMNCLQMDPVDWFAEVCLDGILQMGPARASALLEYLVAQAEKPSVGAPAGQESSGDAGEEALGLGTVPMRGAALRRPGEQLHAGGWHPHRYDYSDGISPLRMGPRRRRFTLGKPRQTGIRVLSR